MFPFLSYWTSTHKKSHDFANSREEDTFDNRYSNISVRGTCNRLYDAFKVTANSLYTDATFSLLLITLTRAVHRVRLYACTCKWRRVCICLLCANIYNAVPKSGLWSSWHSTVYGMHKVNYQNFILDRDKLQYSGMVEFPGG